MILMMMTIMRVTSLTVILTDLGPRGRRQSVGCEVVLGPEAEPVVILARPPSQQLGGQLSREVVLSEALHRDQVAAVTFAKI